MQAMHHREMRANSIGGDSSIFGTGQGQSMPEPTPIVGESKMISMEDTSKYLRDQPHMTPKDSIQGAGFRRYDTYSGQPVRDFNPISQTEPSMVSQEESTH